MAQDTLAVGFGFPNQHSKTSIEPHIDFEIFKNASEFSRHDIQSSKIENLENSRTMQRDSGSTINHNQNTQLINRQTSFHSSSNSSSFTVIRGFTKQPSSGNVIKEFSRGENVSLRPTKKELNWWIQNINLYNRKSLITPPGQIITSSDGSSPWTQDVN